MKKFKVSEITSDIKRRCLMFGKQVQKMKELENSFNTFWAEMAASWEKVYTTMAR